MKFTASFLLLFVFYAMVVHAQKKVYHPFSGSLAISMEGQGNLGLTDYSTPIPDFGARGMLEYYFPLYSRSFFGIRIAGNGGYISGKKPKQASDSSEFRTDMTYIDAGLIYGIATDAGIYPYIFAGAAYLKFNTLDANANTISGKAGDIYKKNEIAYTAELGFRFLISDNLTLNFGGAAHISPRDYLDGTKFGINNDMFLSGFAGFTFTFFNSKDSDEDGVPDDRDLCTDTPAGVRVDQFGCPVDADKDGVPDYLDECPGTPEGVKVNQKGCALDTDGDGVPDYLDLCPGTLPRVAVDENGCPKDSDSDGVPDYLDKCPDTPKGVLVDENGCPKDSDGDGVPDYLDKCPNTPGGTQVDTLGCPLQKEQVIREVPVIKEVQVEKQIVLSAGASFRPGKAELLSGAFPELDKLVSTMRDNSRTKWVIEGHTDNTGSEEGNKKLSRERAQAVLKYFVSKGISKERLTVRGLGADYPVSTNATDEGRQKNRRVVITRVN